MPADYIAVYSPDAGVLNATKSCAMFQRLAAERGAVLRDRTVRVHPGGCTRGRGEVVDLGSGAEESQRTPM